VNRAPQDDRRHVDASLRPASAALPSGGTTKFTVDIVAQSPLLLRPTVQATGPAGWKIRVQPPSPVLSWHLPTSATATVTVTAPTGVADGTYPITVTVGGANTVTRVANVVIRPALACAAGTSCALDLTQEQNRDGTASVADPAQGDFDTGGWSFDADLLPRAGAVTWNNVVYQAPDPTGTTKNFVSATGQSLVLPQAAYTSLELVATTHNGPVSGGLTIGYADGSAETRTITVADWCGSAVPGTTTVLAMPHRIKAGQGVDGPPVSLFGVSVPLAAGKQIRSITLPADSRLNLYAITLR